MQGTPSCDFRWSTSHSTTPSCSVRWSTSPCSILWCTTPTQLPGKALCQVNPPVPPRPSPAIPDSYNWYLLLLIRQDNEKPYEFLHLMTYTYYEVNKFHSIIFYGYLRSYNGFFSSHFHFSNPATKIYQIIVLLKLHWCIGHSFSFDCQSKLGQFMKESSYLINELLLQKWVTLNLRHFISIIK